MDSQGRFEFIGTYVRLESLSTICPQLPLPVFAPPSAVFLSTSSPTTTPTTASVPSLRSNVVNSSPRSLPPSSPQHPNNDVLPSEPAILFTTPLRNRRSRSNVANSPFQCLPSSSPQREVVGDVDLLAAPAAPVQPSTPVRDRRFRSNAANSPFRSLPPSPLPQPNDDVLLPAAVVQPNVSLRDQLRSYVLPILPAEQSPTTVLPVTVQRLRQKKLVRGTRKGDRRPIKITGLPLQKPLSTLPEAVQRRIRRFDTMFLQQTRVLRKWALLNRTKVGHVAANTLGATTPEKLAEQALKLVPNQLKYAFAKEGTISLDYLKKLSSSYPPTTMEGNYLIIAYPEDDSFFALYGGMSQMDGSTLARCTRYHASKSSRKEYAKKYLYQVIDKPGQPSLNISALGLLNGTDLDRDVLSF